MWAGRSSRRALWGADDLLRWVALITVGFVMIVAAWFVVSGEAQFAEQVGMADLAVGGLLVACAGHVMWVLSGRRAVGERRRFLLGDPGRIVLPADRPGVAVSGEEQLVAGAGTKLFHRPNCRLVVGRDWPVTSREELVRAGRVPCGVCLR
jgi:hypothetical protein